MSVSSTLKTNSSSAHSSFKRKSLYAKLHDIYLRIADALLKVAKLWKHRKTVFTNSVDCSLFYSFLYNLIFLQNNIW